MALRGGGRGQAVTLPTCTPEEAWAARAAIRIAGHLQGTDLIEDLVAYVTMPTPDGPRYMMVAVGPMDNQVRTYVYRHDTPDLLYAATGYLFGLFADVTVPDQPAGDRL